MRYKDILYTLVLASAITLLYFSLLRHLPFMQSFYLRTLDWGYQIKYQQDEKRDSLDPFTLIAIDEGSMNALKMRWPWPRSVIADVVDRLSTASPKVIALDLVFGGESQNPQEDQLLVEAFQRAGNVVITLVIPETRQELGPPGIISQSASGMGHVNTYRDLDGVIRRFTPFIFATPSHERHHAMSVVVTAKAMGISPEQILVYDKRTQQISVNLFGSERVPQAPLYENRYLYPARYYTTQDIRTVPVQQILQGQFEESAIHDKIVFVGATGEFWHDIHPTPVGYIPGVLIQILATLSFLKTGFMTFAPSWFNWILVILLGVLMSGISLRAPLLRSSLVFVFLVLLVNVLYLYCFIKDFIWDGLGCTLTLMASFGMPHVLKYTMTLLENTRLQREVVRDGLTQLFTYKYFVLKLKQELRKTIANKENLAIAILDLDHFKNINDTYGHEMGNEVLKGVAETLRRYSKRTDTIARYGGEEFAIIMPNTPFAGAAKHLQDLIERIRSLEFKNGEKVIKVTTSIGFVTTKDYTTEDVSSWIQAADQALYRAKGEGRNCIAVYSP